MTSDPPLAEFEDVRIGNWQSRLPSAVCTDKEIFDEIFSLQTWKSALKPEQRDRILKTLPPDLLKIPGAAEKTIEDLFSKALTNFGSNPLDTFFEKLDNGHFDPEVVETKTNIVREWKRESVRLRKNYHTKLLQDIVISREKHLHKFLPLSKKNGKKALSASNTSNKKNGKPAATIINNNNNNNNNTSNTNGVGAKGNKHPKNDNSGNTGSTPSRNKSGEQNKNKRSRDSALSSPLSVIENPSEGPTRKKSRQQNPSAKSKTTSKKTKDIVIVTTQQPPPPPQTVTNGTGIPSTTQQKSVLLGTLSAATPLTTIPEPPTLSLRSPSAAAPPPPTSLLESLTAPINPPLSVVSSEASSSLKQYQKIFPAPSPTLLSNPSPSPSPSFLPSPVQSSPILASQLQAPSPISVNLNTITGLRSSGSSASPSSASQSSITLNYTQAPPVSSGASQQNKGLLEDDSSSDEFEFETIEPTIGFSGSTIPSSKPVSSVSSSVYKSSAIIAPSCKKGQPTTQLTSTISSQQLANIQKCSLLTNCLTQPLSNPSSVAAAALANNILTAGSQTIAQQLQSHQKVIVTSGMQSSEIAAQLHKFISAPITSSSITQTKLTHQDQTGGVSTSSGNIFQQKNVISAITNPNAITSSTLDAQALVNSIMASSKDLLTNFGASIGPNHQQQTTSISTSPSVLPISVNLHSVGSATQQTAQLKQTYIRTPVTTGLLPSSVVSQSQQQILALPPQPGQGTSLNTQSLQLPSSILSSKSSSTSIPNLLDTDDLSLNLGSFSMGLGMNLDMAVGLPDIDGSIGGTVDSMKLEIDCGMDKIDDLSVLDGNPFDSIPNLSDELDGLDLDMVDGLCDFDGLLSEEKQYSSFFSLIRDVLCSTRDHRMTLVCMEKTIRKWALSPAAALNPWYMRVTDWNSALIVALNFLAGNYQDVHPEDFVPYIEYKYKTKYYQWIGAGRDGDNNLTPLCNLWMDNLDRLPPLKKAEGDGDEPEEEEDENEDSDTAGGEDAKKKNKRPQTPPPPRCTTDWTVRPSTVAEKDDFRAQEKSRFDNPHKAFTYRMHGYESVVGPVKGVYSSQTGITNKARGHSLLVDDRPPYVTILALVRDAVARLPNGEGTRSEICEMLRDSAFLAPEASNVTLNSVVSGALDRLHYERDPCVRYDSHKKSWIYLHRDRTQEQFERLHHNRSYTKSTKSRNNSNRKSRKGSSKTSQASTVITATTTTSSSSSSSQSSMSAISSSETPQSVGTSSTSTSSTTSVATGSGSIASSSSAGSLITLPSLSSIPPKIHNVNTLAPKQTIGLVSVPVQHQTSNIQVQSPVTTQSAISGSLTQTIATMPGNRGITATVSSLSGESVKNTGNLQPPTGGESLQPQQSLNDVLAAAAAGLRFQAVQSTQSSVNTSTGPPVVFGKQGKPQQSSVVPDQTTVASQQQAAMTTRLLIQPNAQTSLQIPQQTQSQHPQAAQVQIQNSGIISGNMQGTTMANNPTLAQPSAATTATAISPGQILLGSSAVLKLAGNIRLGDGLRLTQLRLPGTAGGMGTATSPLRLPQHRILLARGAIPGQPQAQGVLLGQTSTGQTVILSAASPTVGALGMGSLQQALSNSGAAGVGIPGQLSQIAVHASMDSSQTQLQQSQITSNLQQSVPTTAVSQQNLAFTTQTAAAAAAAKFGIITNVPMGAQHNSGSIIVSSGTSPSVAPQVQPNLSTGHRIISASAQQQSSMTSGLVPTSSSTSATSLISAVQAPVSSSMSVQPPNITVSNTHVPQQQQLNLSSVVSGLSNCAPSSGTQTQPQLGSVQAVGVPTAVQLQGVAQAVQQQQHHSVMAQLQSQQTNSQHQGQNPTTQLTAPIIIRSAQGDFVSFGIPSHLSLGRGMQGIKVIPFQAGKQTVLARIVAPGTTTNAGVVTGTSINTNVNVSSSAVTNVGVGSTVSLQSMNAVMSPVSITTSSNVAGVISTTTAAVVSNPSSTSTPSS